MITREEAWNLLTKYNKEAFHIQHALTVEGTMKYFAENWDMEKKQSFGLWLGYFMI